MSDNLDILVQRITEAISRGSDSKTDKSNNRSNINDLTKDINKFRAALQSSTETLNKYSALFKTGRVPDVPDITPQLDALDQAIKKTTDAKEKDLLKRKKQQLIAEVGYEKTQRASMNFGLNLVDSGAKFVSGMAGVTKTLVTNLTQSGSEAKLFSSLVGAGLDILANGANFAGSVLTSLGGVAGGIMSTVFPKFGKVLESAVGGLSKAFSSVFGVAASAVSQAVEMVFSQVEQYSKSFNILNRVGATFSSGLGEMIKTANQGGLMLEQFARVVSENSSNIASAGLGVTEGSKKLSGALEKGGSEMRRRLLNLGYSVEEQAGLVAETMKSMAGMAGPLKASDREVAVQTEKYAQNLRLITAITGEDAKKKIEAARQDMMNLRFQQQLNKLTGEQRTQIDQAMAAAPAAARKMAIEIANTGTIITPALAVLANSSPEMKRLAEMLAEGAKTGNTSVTQVADYMKANGETIRQSMQSQEAMALAAFARPDSLAGEVSKLMLDTMSYASKATKEAIDASLNQIKEGAEADKKDPLTNLHTTTIQKMQELRVIAEGKISTFLSGFADALSDTVTRISNGLNQLANAFDAKELGNKTGEEIKKFNNLFGTLPKESDKSETDEYSTSDKQKSKPDDRPLGSLLSSAAGSMVGAGVGGAAGGIVGAGVGGALGQSLIKESGKSGVTKMAIKRVVGAALGGVGTLLGGGVGSLITGAAGYYIGDYLGEKIYDAFFAETEKRAKGGPINKNTPYIVGEEGPELRIFEKDGAIIPTDIVKNLLKDTGGLMISLISGIQRAPENNQLSESASKDTSESMMSLISQIQRATNTQLFGSAPKDTGGSMISLISGIQRATENNQLFGSASKDTSESMISLISEIQRATNNQTFTNTQIYDPDKTLTTSVGEKLTQIGMFIEKSAIDQQSFISDLRKAMQVITDSTIMSSERLAVEVGTQLTKTVDKLISLPTTVKGTNTNNLGNNIMQEQTNLLQEMTVRQQYEMLSVLNEIRNIQQQILNYST